MPDVRASHQLRAHPPAYYGAADPKGGGVDNGARIFAQASCHHRPEVYSGIGESEAATLLRSFFQDRR